MSTGVDTIAPIYILTIFLMTQAQFSANCVIIVNRACSSYLLRCIDDSNVVAKCQRSQNRGED